MKNPNKNAPSAKGASQISCVQLDGVEHQNNTENLIEKQALWLCRRAMISTPMARVMAELHFRGAA